jgi:hypothetical protein
VVNVATTERSVRPGLELDRSSQRQKVGVDAVSHAGRQFRLWREQPDRSWPPKPWSSSLQRRLSAAADVIA